MLEQYHEEEKEELMIQISVRCRDVDDSENYDREQCEECDADVCVSDDYAMEIDTGNESVETEPEGITPDQIEVFLCQVCGMKLLEEKGSEGNGVAM